MQIEWTGFVNELDVRYETKRGDQDDVRILMTLFVEIWNILGEVGVRWKIRSLVLDTLHFRWLLGSQVEMSGRQLDIVSDVQGSVWGWQHHLRSPG